jgi:hypothetical protein
LGCSVSTVSRGSSKMPSNNALLTDALGLQLRSAHRAAKRGR